MDLNKLSTVEVVFLVSGALLEMVVCKLLALEFSKYLKITQSIIRGSNSFIAINI